jgi:hypothetical protein
LSAIFFHLYRNPSTEKLKALFDFVKVLVDFFPKESILMPYLKQLLSARSRITRGRFPSQNCPSHALPQADTVCEEMDQQMFIIDLLKSSGEFRPVVHYMDSAKKLF